MQTTKSILPVVDRNFTPTLREITTIYIDTSHDEARVDLQSLSIQC
jgi:hypothetical protein